MAVAAATDKTRIITRVFAVRKSPFVRAHTRAERCTVLHKLFHTVPVIADFRVEIARRDIVAKDFAIAAPVSWRTNTLIVVIHIAMSDLVAIALGIAVVPASVWWTKTPDRWITCDTRRTVALIAHVTVKSIITNTFAARCAIPCTIIVAASAGW